jgi:hypothetical protein
LLEQDNLVYPDYEMAIRNESCQGLLEDFYSSDHFSACRGDDLYDYKDFIRDECCGGAPTFCDTTPEQRIVTFINSEDPPCRFKFRPDRSHDIGAELIGVLTDENHLSSIYIAAPESADVVSAFVRVKSIKMGFAKSAIKDKDQTFRKAYRDAHVDKWMQLISHDYISNASMEEVINQLHLDSLMDFYSAETKFYRVELPGFSHGHSQYKRIKYEVSVFDHASPNHNPSSRAPLVHACEKKMM